MNECKAHTNKAKVELTSDSSGRSFCRIDRIRPPWPFVGAGFLSVGFTFDHSRGFRAVSSSATPNRWPAVWPYPTTQWIHPKLEIRSIGLIWAKHQTSGAAARRRQRRHADVPPKAPPVQARATRFNLSLNRQLKLQVSAYARPIMANPPGVNPIQSMPKARNNLDQSPKKKKSRPGRCTPRRTKRIDVSSLR